VWFGRLAPAVWGGPGASVSGVEVSLVGKSGTWCRERKTGTRGLNGNIAPRKGSFVRG
jgi:hypothetical protein